MSTPPLNSSSSNRENCPKMSSACVIWQGPNIPCINLCTGDSIDEVVFKLATILCEISEGIIDISSLDLNFSCMVPAGQTAPASLQETLQLIINNVCLINESVGDIISSENDGSTSKVGNPLSKDEMINLPSCLFFTNPDGDYITSLPVTEYSSYLATSICVIINDINTIKVNISNINFALIYVQSILESFSTYTYEIYVTSQCASNETPGTSLLIQDAFQNLEAAFCNLQQTVGIPSALVSAIENQCPGLESSQQLANPSLIMGDIPTWVSSPSNVPDTISNLWATICDMRSAVQSIVLAPPPTIPCILVPQLDTEITSATTTYATISWTDPSTTISGMEAPINYRVEVYDWTGTAITGPILYTQTIDASFTSLNVPIGTLTPSAEYGVLVYAIYNCGEADPVQVSGVLITPTILYKMSVKTFALPDTSFDCLESGVAVTYVQENKRTTVELVNAISGLPVTVGAADIDVVVRYAIDGCDAFGTVYDDVTITISIGSSSATYDFASKYYINCGTLLCTPKTKTISCGVSIDDPNTEFETAFPVC
jgi:hypothetical protein